MKPDNFYDRDNETENVLVFPGNHDCNTIYGWYKTLDDDHKWKLKEFLKRNNCNDINVNIGIMQYLSKCKAKMPVIMVQDILGLDESARINVPGTESDKNSRTALHVSTCKEEGLTYKVIYEKDDRLFGDQVISQTRQK